MEQKAVVPKSIFAGFLAIYVPILCVLTGLASLYARIWTSGVALIALGVAMFFFDRWTKKRV